MIIVLKYYIPKLGRADERQTPKFELEYVTYTIEALHPKGDGGYPIPLGHLPEELRRPRAGGKSRYVPYSMEDLTVGSWMRMGRALGESRKLRRKFREYMFMSGS